jgi:hypothetical protein
MIATAIATVVSIILARLEAKETAQLQELREREVARQEAAREAVALAREQAARAREEYKAGLASIENALDQLNRDMNQATLESRIEVLSMNVGHLVQDTGRATLEQLYELRRNIDPKFVHPHEPIVAAVMATLDAEVPAEAVTAEVEPEANSE